MPIFATSHFIIDLPTLCVVTVFMTSMGGLLLLFAWLQNRSELALALWGVGYLLGSLGAALLALGALLSPIWQICTANALICAAYGVLWAGARSFEGRPIRPAASFAGALLWIIAYQLGALATPPQRVVLASLICASYVLLAAREVWHARDRELISRWPTMAILILHAGFLLARVPVAGALSFSAAAGELSRMAFFVMAFEALFATFCVAFLRMSMAKERAELQQRKAALTDSLTGVPNRRAFFDFGDPLLERNLAERRPAALLLFDLDRFKQVNDSAGHQAGDRVLCTFAELVASAVRPGDLFARLGGEEFACLLMDAPMAAALQMADRLRRDFAAVRFADLSTNPTVSVGVAMAGEAGRNLSVLLATADRALYRAKAEGRNRVAPAPLVLVDAHGVDAPRQPPEFGRATVAPVAAG